MDKDVVLNFRVPRDLKLALREAANQDERSMSTMAIRILREWLAANGYLSQSALKGPVVRTTARRGLVRGSR